MRVLYKYDTFVKYKYSYFRWGIDRTGAAVDSARSRRDTIIGYILAFPPSI